MQTPILNTPLQVLDNILALNLNITLWSARKKLTAEDFGGVELPPDDLASLGSKKICDPACRKRIRLTAGQAVENAENF